MTKYKQYFKKMLSDHSQLFENFQKTHSQYLKDRHAWQETFNIQGKQVVDIIQQYESKLCSHSEKGQFGKFSDKLAEKFQAEVKKLFPLIDFVGVTIEEKHNPEDNSIANIKKISF